MKKVLRLRTIGKIGAGVEGVFSSEEADRIA